MEHVAMDEGLHSPGITQAPAGHVGQTYLANLMALLLELLLLLLLPI